MKNNKAAVKRALVKGTVWKVQNNILNQESVRTVGIVQSSSIAFLKDDGMHSWLDFSFKGHAFLVNDEGTRIEVRDSSENKLLIYTRES